jgi:hypothetical protein
MNVWCDCQTAVNLEVNMRILVTVAAVVMSSLVLSSPAVAQGRHVVDLGAVRQAVADQATTDQQNRDAVLTLLHRSDVKGVADHLGLSVTRAENAVSTLDSAELARFAGQARTASADLAGGQDIKIPLLLVLVIVIVVLLIVR